MFHCLHRSHDRKSFSELKDRKVGDKREIKE
jgi:hypothetical protein